MKGKRLLSILLALTLALTLLPAAAFAQREARGDAQKAVRLI